MITSFRISDCYEKKQRKDEDAWQEEAALFPQKMSYKAYKENFPNAQTVPNSYNPSEKTLLLYLPKGKNVQECGFSQLELNYVLAGIQLAYDPSTSALEHRLKRTKSIWQSHYFIPLSQEEREKIDALLRIAERKAEESQNETTKKKVLEQIETLRTKLDF